MLLGVNLAILLLPLLAIGLDRVYESELLRRTEAELIAQGAVVAAAYRHALLGPVEDREEDAPFHPITPRLDLSEDPIFPRAPAPLPSGRPPDPEALRAGAQITSILREAQGTTLAGIRVVDPSGTVVATSREELLLSLAHREEVARALRGEAASLIRERVSDSPVPKLPSISRSAHIRIFVAIPVVHEGRVHGAVIASRTPVNLIEALHEKRALLLAGSLALVAMTLLVSVVSSRLVSRPVRALVERTRRVAGGDRDALRVLQRPGTREVAELSEAFTGMARSLQERSDYVRAFADSLSHELKAPLTSIKGAVELLRDHGPRMTHDERERFLGNVTTDVERLERLVRKLLELARADASVPTGERASVSAVVARVAERHAGIVGSADVSPDAGEVLMAPDLLETILGSLVENARQHVGGAVKVSIAVERSGDRVVIRVLDDGPGVSAAHASRVFDPLFTTARAAGGTGLGLTVVRSLLRAHGGDVALETSGRGACFRLDLPASN